MLEGFIIKIKRAETPFYARLKNIARAFLSANIPYPRFLRSPLRGMFQAHLAVTRGARWLWVFCYASPLFRARCESVGRNFRLSRFPDMQGPVIVRIGHNVNFFGKVDIYSGSIFKEPRLIVGNRVNIGHNVNFVVNREIVIEDDVMISSGVRFMDSDAHPRDASDRASGCPPKPEEIKPVRVCRFAWIGQNVFILKGVTVGEGAIVGVNSVVVTDVPPYSVVMGNPARVVVKNVSASPSQPPVS